MNPRGTNFTYGDYQRYRFEDESKGWGVRSREGGNIEHSLTVLV